MTTAQIEYLADRLLCAARHVAILEADPWTNKADWRQPLGDLSAYISWTQPDLDPAIRTRALADAGDNATVRDLLTWASLDTGIAEAAAAAAHDVCEEVFHRKGGASDKLKDAVRLSRGQA